MTEPLGSWLSSRHRRGIAAIVIGLALIGGVVSRPSQAQGAQTAPSDEPSGIKLKELGAPRGAEQEEELRAIIETAIAEEQKSGTWKRLDARTLELLSPQALALSTLKQNLTISTARDEARRVRDALQEAAAVFDPVLTLSFAYQRSETLERTVPGTVEAQVFLPRIADPQRSQELIDPNDSDAQRGVILLAPEARALTGIDRIVYTEVRTTRTLQDETIFASREDPNGPSDRFEYTVALDQQLPWGARYNVSVLTADQDVFYDLRGNSYGASWSSSLLFNLEVPLPGAKDFGPYAPFDTQLKLADKDRELAFWIFQSTINDTLLASNLTYLDLLEALESLAIQIENRKLLTEQLRFTQRLLRARQATTYDVAQVEGELARAHAAEEAAANRFIATSDALSVLIEDSPEAVRKSVYVPSGYSPWLRRRLDFDEAAALMLAKQHQPLLQASRVGVERSQILRRQARQQVRPDVTANMQIESLQNGAVYGYNSFGDSWGGIADPDTLNQSYGIRYRYPFGNRTFEARLTQATGQLSDSQLERRQTSNDVIRDVNNALTSIKTSRARIARSNEQLQAAEAAYTSLARREEANADINRNELILIIRRLLAARLAHVSALIDNKRAESALLAAQGFLPRHYAPWTSRNAFETHRLKRLKATGQIDYFLD
ncbi:MAG: TolC family protein [Gammaproteobacteria bacterium]